MLADQTGDPFARGLALSGLANVAGEQNEAEARARESIAVFEGSGHDWGLAFARDTLGMLRLAAGDGGEAVGLLESALSGFRAAEERRGIAVSLFHLASALGTVEGHHAAVREELLRESLTLAVALRDREAGARAIEGLAGLAADSGQWRRGARLLGAAEGLRESVGGTVRTLDVHAELKVANAAPDPARFEGERQAGRALNYDQAVDYALRPAGSGATGPGLTPREAGVLRHLAQGLTNREIASVLVLNVKTVERHVANIYARIGVRSRVEATTYALRHDLA